MRNKCTKSGSAKELSTSTKDDNNAKLLVLLTALVNKADGGATSSTCDCRGKHNVQSSIADWRKSKSHGESIYKDGKMYYWCKQHQDGKVLFVIHHLKDHGKKNTEWEHTDRSRNVKSSQSTSAQQSNNSNKSSDSKLQLSDKMKAALISQGINGANADSLLKGLQDSTSGGAVDFW